MSRLLYYKCMPPEYLRTTVTGVSTAGSDDTELEIGQDAQDNEVILREKIFTRRHLHGSADITVAINVACEGPPPKVYDPISFMVSDGDRCMGVQLRDPSEYHSIGPYQGIYGEDGRRLSNIEYIKSTEKDINYTPGQLQRWPQMFRILLKPSSYWGMCSSAANGGISLSYGYPRQLRLDDGLDLVVFRNKSTEKYIINMIEVTVYHDQP